MFLKALRNTLVAMIALVAASSFAFGQSADSVGPMGVRAYAFAYGNAAFKRFTPPAPLRVDIGTSATGAGTITLAFGVIHTNDGINFMPFSTSTKITVGTGANAESVTPSAVSCTTPTVYDTCQITATFSNLHGTGDLVSSASYGVEEAALYAASILGGYTVLVDRAICTNYSSLANCRTGVGAFLGYSIASIVFNIGDAAGAAFSKSSAGTYPTAAAYSTTTTTSWY